MLSLPSRERGLKSDGDAPVAEGLEVAPFAGAWIEIAVAVVKRFGNITSLPSRERGLK